ncbi:hypothetical protein [Alkaliphilus transvaalensis]|uniref:hypothetical protein n=1 Tax=Alkaliphilus transvaalensis TaxID=114628 RepID=UPI00047D7712|nr:hypothetical protein [Alkaliphilus transvaalensis]
MLQQIKMKIQEENGESHLELLVFMFKLLVITLLIFQLSIFVIDYSQYRLAVNETMRKARSEGMLRKDYFEEQLIRMKKSPNEVSAVATPNFGTYVNKLGDRITLHVEYEFQIKFSDMWKINLRIPIRATTTNQGYYGEGYGGGW